MPNAAKNSRDGLCRQATAGLPVSRAVVTAMAISAAPPAFQRAPSLGAQFCALDSWLRHRSSRYAANSHRSWIVGARSRDRLVELAATPRLGHCHRNIPADGLRLLVVALGQSHGPNLLAVS